MARPLPDSSLADYIERILDQRGRGPVPVAELLGELGPGDGNVGDILAADQQLIQGLLQDNDRRSVRGYRPRFSVSDGESVGLRPPGNSAESAVEQWNQKVKDDLLRQLSACDPFLFEKIVARLLIGIGYEEVRVTKRSGDKGIDVSAILSVGGVTRVPTLIQVKRTDSVGRPDVQRLRGSIGATQQGVMVTTGRFSREAVSDAKRQDGNPVHLIDGQMLADLMSEHSLGVQASRIAIFSIDEQFFATAQPAAPVASDESSSTTQHVGKKYLVDKLPGGSSIAAFQEEFPTITREDEIESDHVILTLLGKRFLDSGDLTIVRDSFLTRVAGAREVLKMVEGVSKSSERRKKVLADPPAGLSATQVKLVLEWLPQLGFVA